MKFINLEQPPLSLGQEACAYINRLIVDVNEALKQVHNHEGYSTMPEKYGEGDVVYFKQAVAPLIAGKGWWGFDGTNWVQLG